MNMIDKESKSILTCKNCNRSFTGKYCYNCGQKYIEKITFKSLFSKVFEIFELESGFILTLLTVLCKPKIFFDEYLSGKTKPYTNPILFMITIMAFIAILLHLHFKFVLGGDGFDSNLTLYAYFTPYILLHFILIKAFYPKRYKELLNYFIISIYSISILMIVFIQFILAKYLDSLFDISLFFKIHKIVISLIIPYLTIFTFWNNDKKIIQFAKGIAIGLLFIIGFDKITSILDNSTFLSSFFN